VGIGFRLAHQGNLQALWESCYPETDWEQFQEHYRYLLRWQERGRCYILLAEWREGKSRGGIEALGDIGEDHLEYPVIVGSGQLIPQREKAEIAELVVHPDFRNRGIGTAMIEILTRIAQERNIHMLEIGAAVENQAALRLYRRLGFGRERILRLQTGQEAIILYKRFTYKDKDDLKGN
jgi:ribosomal protein S18 acetylase RimI-like enzyme